MNRTIELTVRNKDIHVRKADKITTGQQLNKIDIFFDGESHFFIDGIDSYPNSVRDDDRIIPLLVYEETDGEGAYFSLLENGERKLLRL